ncbi:MAG: HD domain-containing protein [Candidatus Nezhaarchaeota archaeon]|nr:HD domain-containing protein [Candidatus Nezhaarchaeota archaeon]
MKKNPKVWGEIRDPVHGYVIVNELEKSVLDTYPMQRLHRIKQLGNAHLTYPGADHSRFGHSLGVLHLASIASNKLLDLGFSIDELQELRLAALLHDVGHGPFSHLFEEAVLRYKALSHEDLTMKIIGNTEIKDKIEEFGYSPHRISLLSVGRLSSPLSILISGPFDLDKLDFLLRDSYYTGVEYGKVDAIRLLMSLRLVDASLALELPASLYALESLLISRYEMFKAVYFHKTVRAAWVMLRKAVNIAYQCERLFDFDNIEDYLSMDDGYVELELRKLSKRREALTKEMRISCDLHDMLERRNLFKSAYEIIVHKTEGTCIIDEKLKEEIEETIAGEAKVDRWMVVVDTPMIPSLPYTPTQPDPMEIPVCEEKEGVLVKRRLVEFSKLVESLRGYVDIIRVYSHPNVRKEVTKASERVIGSLLPRNPP